MLRHELLRRQAEGRPIRVGASGIEWMGSGFVTAMSVVPGMELVVLANADVGEAIRAYESTGVPRSSIIIAEAPEPAMDALRAGKRVVTPNLALLPIIEAVDIVADSTYSPAIGAELAYHCIQAGKDIVLINIEADVTVGRILKKLAADAGVLYTVSSGDEPGCLMELVDFVTCLGYELIAAGKGKNNPLDPSATPETVAESARKANKDPYQVASYVDGTKTMFEMTCAANALGLVPIRPGMLGPDADLSTVAEVFALQEDGGLVPYPGVIDFVQGAAMAGGVWVNVRIENQRIADDLNYLKVGKGKYFTFFRPYHLWFHEAPISIARAYLHREVWLAPLDQPVAENVAVAKRDLKPGETLDGFGGYSTFGRMLRAEDAHRARALPVGLAPGARMRHAVTKGAYLTWEDVELDETSSVVKLRRQQDELITAH